MDGWNSGAWITVAGSSEFNAGVAESPSLLRVGPHYFQTVGTRLTGEGEKLLGAGMSLKQWPGKMSCRKKATYRTQQNGSEKRHTGQGTA
jgi:hypothetical protein